MRLLCLLEHSHIPSDRCLTTHDILLSVNVLSKNKFAEDLEEDHKGSKIIIIIIIIITEVWHVSTRSIPL
jgi:hypothetical protein